MKPILLSLAALSLISCSKSDHSKKSAVAAINETIASDEGRQGEATGTSPVTADGTATNNEYTILIKSSLALVEDVAGNEDPMADEMKDDKGNKGKGKRDVATGEEEELVDPLEKGKAGDAAKEAPEEASEELAATELAQCSAHFGVPAEGVKISGRGETIEVGTADIVALKVTGTTNNASVSLTSDNPEVVAGLTGVCLVLMGNESQVSINLSSVSLGSVIVIARGASAGAVFNVAADSEIKEWIDDISGTAVATTMAGDGVYPEPITVDRSSEKNLDAMAETRPGKDSGKGKPEE